MKQKNNRRVDFVFPEEDNKSQNFAEIKYEQVLSIYKIKSLNWNSCFIKVTNKIVSIYIIIYIY